MKKTGYIIGLSIGIAVFVLLINFLFFRGNNPTEIQVNEYIKASIVDTVFIPNNTPYNKEQYIAGLSRRGNPSAFLYKYVFFNKKYKKYFSLMMFKGLDPESQNRFNVFCAEGSPAIQELTVRINEDQLNTTIYGSKENPVPIFAIDLINLTGGFTKDPFHVSNQANFIFVEQYLKFFMPKDEFKEMFKK